MARLMDQIIGHDKVRSRLISVAAGKEFFPGVIFAGPEGVGKKQMALALLQELNCESKTACGQCKSCQRISSDDADEIVQMIEPQGASIKVDDIREVIRFVSLKSWVAHRFVVVDPIELMTAQAANALLKVLEEPPEGVHFVFITSSLSQVLPTIRSRCQVISFGALTDVELRQIDPALQDWQVSWSLGRLSLAQKIADGEWGKLRQKALSFLAQPLDKNTHQELVAAFKDRTKLDFVVHCWMSFLRDTLFSLRGEAQIYNQDCAEMVSGFSRHPQLAKLYDQIQQLRRDIRGNVDKNLVMDQLAYLLTRGV